MKLARPDGVNRVVFRIWSVAPAYAGIAVNEVFIGLDETLPGLESCDTEVKAHALVGTRPKEAKRDTNKENPVEGRDSRSSSGAPRDRARQTAARPDG